uniref:PAP-associated domain-containing protein n=1 Tax=Angiostrongylus cantonensis TaxID=6313 RepID=A0A0K0DAS4_ANGCA
LCSVESAFFVSLWCSEPSLVGSRRNCDRLPPISRKSSTLNILDRLSERVLSSNSRFVQVGSSVNGLSCDDSDIDLVPLLIILLENGHSIDIQFPDENFQAIRNTNLIRHYVQCDHRLPRLFLYFRTLFDALEIRNSKYGLLSSYHILLLIIHFLQSEQSLSPWPVLPVLCKTHGNLVGAQIPIDSVVSMLESPQHSIEWCSHNHMTTAELVLRFVDYYATFDASQHVIHIEKGLTTRRKQVSGDVHLLLIDPYSKATVCRSSAAARAFSDSMLYLKRKMANG